MGQLSRIESKLLELGYQILAVSADRPQKLQESIDKHSLTYQLLSDSEMTASRAFGIAYRVDEALFKKLLGFGVDIEEASGETHHLLPVPSAFVLDTAGTIRYRYYNPDHTVRVDPDELLSAARQAVEGG